MQTLVEIEASLAIVADPYRVPDHPRWFNNDGGANVAIYWAGGSGDPACTLLDRGDGFVAVEWGHLAVVGCYVSPNISPESYGEYLDGVANCIRTRCLPRPVIVAGDLNAHSRAWGMARGNRRGEILEEWAAGFDLRLMNRGSVSTYVAWQGESIIDLTWATPSVARLISGWRVAENLYSHSDHSYIVFDVALRPPRQQGDRTPRWSLKRLDVEFLRAAASVMSWGQEEAAEDAPLDPETEAAWFRESMTQICDASMPRTRQPKLRSMYWWSEEIAGLRETCLRSRRHFTRTRRRSRASIDPEANTDPEANAEAVRSAYREYRVATMALQHAISDARSRSWAELLDGLDRDPWGRPYKMVLGKLRPWVPPLTETLDSTFVERVVNTLFPRVHDSPSPLTSPPGPITWSDEWEVTNVELAEAVKRLRARNTAPGPDGIPGRALVLALGEGLAYRLRRLFTSCLRNSVFPTGWKEARLILLQKDGRAPDSPSAFRPICLLDEAGKLFERILAARLNLHLRRVGPDLSEDQFGFRRARSTVDAILRVRELTRQARSRGGVALAVSLDIVNAFNSLPWRRIREALQYHRVPPYLQRIVGSYLCSRCVQYVGRDGEVHYREVECGVPQGSVLGPLLWNLAFDAVLRVHLPESVNVVCYADDTLLIASGDNCIRVAWLAELGLENLVARIGELGLSIAPHKTEALWFHNYPRGTEPHITSILVGNAQVRIGPHLKYLGLILDGHWAFEEHFRRLVPRVERVAGALHRLLPNLGGPQEGVRRLYAGVVRSVALYGAPVWSGRFAFRSCNAKVLSVQRKMAIRIARGYRTISYDAATVLARFPPLDILADMDAKVYFRTRQVREGPELLTAAEVREEERRRALITWRERLELPESSHQRAVDAILPNFEAWLKRAMYVTFRLTQILTGHGCFGEYLNRIGRERTPMCHHCGGGQDTAQHTLEMCPAWCSERRILRGRIGQDLRLSVVVAAMLADEEAWAAMVSFCESVMLQKETAERDRERSDPARRRRTRRGGGGGRPGGQ